MPEESSTFPLQSKGKLLLGSKCGNVWFWLALGLQKGACRAGVGRRPGATGLVQLWGRAALASPLFFCLSLSRFNTTREKVSQVTFFLTPWFCNFFMNRCGNFISNSKIWDFPRHNHCEFSGRSPPLSHKLGVLRRWWEPMRR